MHLGGFPFSFPVRFLIIFLLIDKNYGVAKRARIKVTGKEKKGTLVAALGNKSKPSW